MALENSSTPRLMTQLQGKVELPRNQRHIATCNEPVRCGFSEPLPLAVHSTEAGDAEGEARWQDRASRNYLEEKERKLADFQLRVRERLRATKLREKEDKMNKTLLLQETENLLMKSVDPVRRPPLVSSPLIAINNHVTPSAAGQEKETTELLVKCNKYARSRLLGEKGEVVVIPSTGHKEEEEEEEAVRDITERTDDRKENVKPSSSRTVSTHNLRIHRLKESRKAYGILERDKMRERARELEHRATAEKLREQTEKDRVLAEQLVNHAISRCKAETPKKEHELEERIEKTVKRNKKISSQTDRLIKRLRSKIANSDLPLPALCPCDTDILKTGPGLCACNCVYYTNSKAFAQALCSLMACYQS